MAPRIAEPRSTPAQSPAGTALWDAPYEVPTFSEAFVRRPALVGRLLAGRGASLALITAPPGYGKTSLLAEWAEHDERPFVWVAVSEHDDEPALLAASILRAFGTSPAVTGSVSQPASQAPDAAAVLAGLALPGESQPPSFVLVLDGADAVSPPVLREVADLVLRRLPADAQLAIASRVQPTLSLGRLRARRALVEIRTADLALTSTDAAALIRLSGFDVNARSVEALVARTEGWPAGLYLAALSLRDRPEADANAERFAGDDHLIVDYLRDEVMDELSRQAADFLVRSSVLDELAGPLCDAVLERQGSGVILNELTRRNLLLEPLDSRHESYRLHGLFRDMLRAELRRLGPAEERSLHLRASAWYAACHDLDRAIDHAVAAGDVQGAGDLLWANILGFEAEGRNDTVQGWLTRFSPAEISGYGPLALAAAHSCLAAGDVARAEHWGRAAVGTPRARTTPTAKARALGLAVVQAACARSGPDRMREDAEGLCISEPPDSPWRPICMLLRGVADHLVGDRDSAERHLDEAFHHSAIAAPGIAALCLAQSAIIAIERDDWETATELADRGAEVMARHDLGDDPTSALAFAASAAARAHQGRVDEAKRDLQHCTHLLSTLGDFIPWYEIETRVLLAHAALKLADTVRARTLLAEASRFARRSRDVAIFQQWFDAAWGHIDAHAEISLVGPSSLTTAELRILRFLPTHLSFREIAGRLHVSSNTVKSQAHAVYRKLDASSRSEAVAHACEAGLLGP